MKVYLTGPLTSAECYADLQEAAYRMPTQYQVITPIDSMDLDLDARHCRHDDTKTILSKRIQAMLSAELIVTMDHCDIDPVSKSEVALARTADMKVVPYWKFMKDHGQA